MGGSFFGAVLSEITSPFSTLAKSSAARGRFDFFSLKYIFIHLALCNNCVSTN